MEEQKIQDNVKENNKKQRKNKKTGGGLSVLHLLQHVILSVCAVLLVLVLLNSFVFIDTFEGAVRFNLNDEHKSSSFEESDMFNQLFGNNVSNIIRLGVIRGQMETEGKFDAGKKVDVTAYANRFTGILPEYVTATYYLEDLIKWAQDSFVTTTVNVSAEELDQFLSDDTVVTIVDTDAYSGGIVSYLNADLSDNTKQITVSGNLLEQPGTDDKITMQILTNKYRTTEGKNIEDYVATKEEYEELCKNVMEAATALNTNYNQYLSLKKYYTLENSNIVYFIKITVGDEDQIFTNMETDSTKVSSLINELKNTCSKYAYYDPKNLQFETNTLLEESTMRYIINGFEYAYPEDIQIMVGVNKSYSAMDEFYQGKEAFSNYVPFSWQYLAGAIFCLFLYLGLLIFITSKEGQVRKKETGEIAIRLHRQDRIFTEIMILAGAGAGAGLFYGISGLINLVWRAAYGNMLLVLAGALALLVSVIFSFFYYSFVRRIKAGTLFKDSLIRRMGKLLKNWIAYCYQHSNVIMRAWIPFVIFVLINIGAVSFMLLTGRKLTALAILAALILFDAAAGFFLYRSSLAKQSILEGIQLIREGNLDHKVKEEGMYGEDLVLARAVNSIGDSVKEAVETSMKDERLKADLITNVSHDIKTPLTSIINYVDLIKRENVQDQKIREYIEVLDAKSQRLKQLTDDLVEASKISSGNIVLQWEKINLVELLNQTIGEFSEKFEKKALYPVFNAPKSSVYIEADSRRIWRVIENLFNNIFKYALEGTRVYIDMTFMEDKEAGKQVILSIKNISAQPLKVNPAELTERFIRGDESRTTEGSGLGLSIAKNLTEAQKGKFEIVMDGDLFKVNMYFPLLKDKE